MALARQVRTKLPFSRKCNWYLPLLDSRYLFLLKIPLRLHFSPWHFSENNQICKEFKTKTLITILKQNVLAS